MFGTLTFGQVNRTFMNQGDEGTRRMSTEPKEKMIEQSATKAAGDVIYSQNFSTLLGDMTTSGTDGALWMRDLDGSNGQWGGAGTELFNTDAANGFAILDANLNSDNNPTHAAAYDGKLVSPAIDMTGRPGALLEFYFKYRYFGTYYQYPTLQVSTNDFATFTEYKIDLAGIRTNNQTPTHKVTVNLSKFLNLPSTTNKTNFKFRISSNNMTLYFMAVDDIKVIETVPFDLKMSDLWLEDINQYYEHTQIPTSLASGQMLTVQSHLVNKGHSNPTNVTMAVSVLNSLGAPVHTQSGGILNNNFSLIDDTLTFATSLDLGTLAVGTYTVKADVNITETDADLTNDTLRRTFERTIHVLGQRNFDLPVVTRSVNRNKPNAADESLAVLLGSIMFVPEDITLQGLEVTIANDGDYYETTSGADIEIQLYQMDFTTTGLTWEDRFIDQGEDRLFTITPSMIPAAGTYKDVLFNYNKANSNPTPIDLLGGNYYMVGVSHPGGLNKHFAFGANTRDDDYSSVYTTNNKTNIYSAGSQIHTRMNFDPALNVKAIASNGLSMGELYPNPTTGKAAINYSIENSSAVAIKIVDITGKVVYSSNEGTKTGGSHKVNVDASAFTNGVYYVTVSTNDSQVTKKMIKN
jgi:hypothetical protein